MATTKVKMQNNLRAVRLRSGLTQEELAQKSGLARSTTSYIDANPMARITLVQAIALSKALGASLYDLLPR